MAKWRLQEAKSRFSELFKELKGEKRVTWKDVLLGEGPRFEIRLPKRDKTKSRNAPV